MPKDKRVKVLTGAAMLLAVAIILSFFKISITEVVEIRFANIPVAVAGILFGPGVGAAVGALSDLAGYVIRPTGPYFPGFTVSAALSGALFGLILRRRLTIARVVLACAVYQVAVGLLLNTLWLHALYGTAFLPLLAVRLPKELVALAFHIVVLTLLVRPAAAMTRAMREKEAHP